MLTDEGGELTSSGERFLCTFGADLMSRPRSRRVFFNLASTGLSVVITSKDSSALQFCAVFWSLDGSSEFPGAAH